MAARQSNWLKKPIDLPAERLLRSCAPWPPLTQRTASSTKLSKQVDKVYGSPSDSATLPWPKQFTMSSVITSSTWRTAILNENNMVIFHDPRCVEYSTPGHPERPARI